MPVVQSLHQLLQILGHNFQEYAMFCVWIQVQGLPPGCAYFARLQCVMNNLLKLLTVLGDNLWFYKLANYVFNWF